MYRSSDGADFEIPSTIDYIPYTVFYLLQPIYLKVQGT